MLRIDKNPLPDMDGWWKVDACGDERVGTALLLAVIVKMMTFSGHSLLCVIVRGIQVEDY